MVDLYDITYGILTACLLLWAVARVCESWLKVWKLTKEKDPNA